MLRNKSFRPFNQHVTLVMAMLPKDSIIKKSWLFIDNYSICTVAFNPNILRNIHELNQGISI